MATRKRAIDEAFEGEEAQELTPIVNNSGFLDDAELTASDRVAGMMQDASSVDNAKVRVYRVKDGSLAYCREYTPENFEAGGLDMIRASFGSGIFEIRLYGVKPETGKGGIRARERVEIEPDAQPATTLAPAVAATEPGWVQAMLNEQKMLREHLMAQSKGGMKEFLETMVLMKNAGLMGAPAPAQTPFAELVQGMRLMKDLSGEFGPGADKSPDMMSVASDLLGVVKEAVQKPAPAPVAPAPVALQPIMLPSDLTQAATPAPVPAGAPAPADQSAQALQSQEEADMIEILRIVNEVYLLAGKADEVNKAADLIYEHMPEEFVEQLQKPDWFALLIADLPQFKEHETWLSLVRTRLLAVIADPDIE